MSLVGKYAIGKARMNKYGLTCAGSVSLVVADPGLGTISVKLLYTPAETAPGDVGSCYGVKDVFFYFVDKVPKKYSLQVSLAQISHPDNLP